MSISYDLIIVAKSSRDDLKRITQQTINTARADYDLNVILIETSGFQHKYQGVDKTIMYQGAFCYNRALNMGIEQAEEDIYEYNSMDSVGAATTFGLPCAFVKRWGRVPPFGK
jgi:hypothetical protein